MRERFIKYGWVRWTLKKYFPTFPFSRKNKSISVCLYTGGSVRGLVAWGEGEDGQTYNEKKKKTPTNGWRAERAVPR